MKNDDLNKIKQTKTLGNIDIVIYVIFVISLYFDI